MKNLTQFEWTEACFIAPYGIVNGKEFSVPGYAMMGDVPNLSDDGSWALLFKDNGKKQARVIAMRGFSYGEQLVQQQCYQGDVWVNYEEKRTSSGRMLNYIWLSSQNN